jgi:hypothetical protein
MSESHITQNDREQAERMLDRLEEHPEEFEDVTDEFLPPKVQALFSDWLREECSQDELMDQLDDFSSSELGQFFVTLREHYERKLRHIREAAQTDIPA